MSDPAPSSAPEQPGRSSLLPGFALALVVIVGAALLITVLANRRQPREEDRKQEEEARRQLLVEDRRHQYADQMKLAQRAWDDGDVERAAELLEGLKPQPEETDQRGFEWHYLRRLCRPELVSIKGLENVTLSPNGRRLVGITGDTLRVWDLHEWQETRSLPLPGKRLSSAGFSGDGSLLAAAGVLSPTRGERRPGVVKVWSVATGKEVFSFEAHGNGETVVVLSPDGKRLAEAACDIIDNVAGPTTLRVTEVPTGKEVIVLKDSKPITRLSFSPDGKRLAIVAEGKEIQLRDAADGKELLKLPGSDPLAFSPDGKQLASVNTDGLKVWDVEFGREVRPVFAAGLVGLTASPRGQGSLLATSTLTAAKPGKEVVTLKVAVKALAFTTDGQRLATAGPDRKVLVMRLSG